MKEIVNLYKSLSSNILDILKEEELDYDQLSRYLDERQVLIESISEENIKLFAKEYKQNLNNIDIEIKKLLEQNLDSSKRELAEYRNNLNGNAAYVKINRTNFNLFSKKV